MDAFHIIYFVPFSAERIEQWNIYFADECTKYFVH